MRQEDRELLLKDLCARLPYGVKIKLIRWDIDEGMYINTTLEPDDIERLLNVEEGNTEIKPYLFPLSSITKKKLEELSEYIDIKNAYVAVEFFNSHHIDYRGLIEKGLAIDATGLGIY